MIYVFDLDGVLAEGGCCQAAKKAKPVWPLVVLLEELRDFRMNSVYIVTARSADSETETREWLSSLGLLSGVVLLTRRDHRPGPLSAWDEAEYKCSVLRELCIVHLCTPPSIMVFEDRREVAERLRAVGFTVLMPQVNDS